MSEQVIGTTSRLLGAVGATIRLRKVTAAVPGHGQIVDRQDKGPLVLSPHRRDGRQGKGPTFSSPRPRATQATGALVGDPPRTIAVASRRDNDVGARTQPTSSHRVFVDVTSAGSWAATPCSMGLTLCHPGPTGRQMLRLRPTRMLPIPPQTW